jgi:hypothetical protein
MRVLVKVHERACRGPENAIEGCKLDCSNGRESVSRCCENANRGYERAHMEVVRVLKEVVRVPIEAVGVF